ncbi:uncharacterized protein LOC127248907 isoform X2 [Andrographis paniculata]|uniref:uncharacterized protein LOC127248907 isoform X2 n=1 Tax=Andrographis paniculata TaxID=175694 RepID=UPI0021E7C8C5|nr:uncharacterized protein LOC127248907 isoform X2 [Andrographis paniculata]
MGILVVGPLPRIPVCPQFGGRGQKSARGQLLRCSKNITESFSSSKNASPVELQSPSDEVVHKDRLDPIGNEKEEKTRDIWKLFEEAQQNIMCLNKQRLLAMEELDRVKNERDSLLDKVKQPKMKKQAYLGKDKFAITAELLLRIDSLVLNGVIGNVEASDFRRLVTDSRGSVAGDLYEIISKNDAEFLAELRHFSKRRDMNGFHIIHICTEMSPVVSVTSLASYVAGLSCALQRKGNLVEVILPKYACLNLDEVQGLREVEGEFYSYFNGQLHGNKVWTGVVYGIGVTFIQPIYYASLFSHEKVYGCPNDFERFTYFSRASLDYLVKSGKRPDVLHIHNWHTSIVGPLFWDVFVNQGFEGTRILLSCQGFDSQCLEQPEKLALCGLDPMRLIRPDRLQDNNKPHLINLLKGGIVYSNKVIIMSALQSKSWIIGAAAHGLEPTLAIHKEKLAIAPFGFDKLSWDPSCDDLLPHNYSAEDMTGKPKCKVALQRRMRFPEDTSTILVGCIYSDILDLDLEKLRMLVWMASRKGVQFIFMKSGQSSLMRIPEKLIREEVKGENVRFIDEYDEELSHLIIAGSDIIVCPSLDDPLHQVPLKAIKYGSPPLPLHFSDTRFSSFGSDDAESSKFLQYIKYTFSNMSLDQAIDEIKTNPSQWNSRIIDGMSKDFSWDSECTDVHVDAYAAIKRLQ